MNFFRFSSLEVSGGKRLTIKGNQTNKKEESCFDNKIEVCFNAYE